MLDWGPFIEKIAQVRGELDERRTVLASLEQSIFCCREAEAGHPSLSRKGLGTPPGQKGTAVLFRDSGQDYKAVVLEILSPTRALIRAFEGPLAGQEIEAEFPAGHLDYWPNAPKVPPAPKPRLHIVRDGADQT